MSIAYHTAFINVFCNPQNVHENGLFDNGLLIKLSIYTFEQVTRHL